MGVSKQGRIMKAHEYNVINADNQQIRKIVIGKRCGDTAADKLRHIYGDKAVFLRLEYNGTREI